MTIRNVGNAAFSLSSLEPSTDQFALAGLPTLPTTIEQGGSVEVQVTFAPTSTGPKDATLTVNGDAPLAAELRGLGVKGDGGNDEPSLQWIFDTFDLNLETGDDDASSTPIANNPSNEALNGLLGNEIKAPSFQKAGNGDVTIEVLAAYGVDNNPVAEFGWYEADNADARNDLFDVESGADNAQTLNPEVDGELSFDPESASFGFYSFWPTNRFFSERYVYTQDELNTFEDAIPHQVRVYPLPGEANAYVLATEEFTQGFDYNDIVVIVRNVKPASLACNQVETVLSSRGDLPSMSVGSLELQNLTGAPFADRLVFSRIGDISQETFGDDREPFPFANLKCHDRNTLRLNNEGGSTISVSDITITGAASGAFVLPNGESSFDISAGDSKDLVVQFTESSGEKGLREATLELQTSAGQVEVELAGIYQKAPEGSREIYLEGVVEAFGYSTDIGANNQGGLSSAEPPGDANFNRAGDEVISRLWQRVDTSKPVYVRQLAAFHSCCSESSNDSLEVRVNGSTIGEFVHAAPYGQAVLPPVEGDLDKAAELSVQPSGPFELVVRDGYSTDWVEGDKNNNNLGVRLWPVERDGSTAGLENSYIVAQDFVENGCGTSETANCDFNDNMYLITNVSPVSTQ